MHFRFQKSAIFFFLFQAINKLRETLNCSHLQDYLTLLGGDPGSNPSLLDLHAHDLPVKPLPPDCHAQVLQQLEERLFEQCCGLLAQLESGQEHRSTQEKFERIRSLPEMVRVEVDNLKRRNEEERGVGAFLAEWKQVEALMRNFEMLEMMAVKYKMGTQTKVDKTNVQYLTIKCQTLVLKIK